MTRLEELQLQLEDTQEKLLHCTIDECHYLFDLERKLKKYICREKHNNVKVGDGVTIHLWSDSEAYTVIKRTPKRITVQRDKATLSSDFKPEWIEGGFAGHCINQNEQSWTYESDPEGRTLVLGWSDKLGGWKDPYGRKVQLGRHEFYDYNF